MRGFADLVDGVAAAGAELVLAGPNVKSVADDPEGIATFNKPSKPGEVCRTPIAAESSSPACRWLTSRRMLRSSTLSAPRRGHRSEEPAEGFGLTVTEAMWKGRPIWRAPSEVSRIRSSMTSTACCWTTPPISAHSVLPWTAVLGDRPSAERLGADAHQRARDEFLGLRHLLDYARLLERVAGERSWFGTSPRGGSSHGRTTRRFLGRSCQLTALRPRVTRTPASRGDGTYTLAYKVVAFDGLARLAAAQTPTLTPV